MDEISASQLETTKHLLRLTPRWYNVHQVTFDIDGWEPNFLSATLEDYYVDDGPLSVDQLRLADGTVLWPAHYVPDEYEDDTLAELSIELQPASNAVGPQALRALTYTEEIRRLATEPRGQVGDLATATLSTANRIAGDHLIALNSRLRDLDRGMWVATEFSDPGTGSTTICAARIALFQAAPAIPQLIPIVYEAEGTVPGYIPTVMTMRDPWLYLPV